MSEPIRILMVDDGTAVDAMALLGRLSDRYQMRRVPSRHMAVQTLNTEAVDVLLLPPGTPHELANSASMTDAPLSLWWTHQSDPLLDVQATRAGLHGTLPLGAPETVEAALEVALARHRRLGVGPDIPTSDAEIGWERPARWRWTAGNDHLILDAAARIPVDRDIVRAVLADEVASQRQAVATHFHHARVLEVAHTPVQFTIHGTRVMGDEGTSSMQGTVTCTQTARLATRHAIDALTGLPSREAFMARLSRAALTYAHTRRAHAVVCIDLDNLRAINDAFGHRTGDLLLQWAAERIRAVAGTAITARVGSDEFAVLLPGPPDGPAPDALARRLLDELATSVSLDGNLVYPSAKAGLAWHNAEHGSADGALRDAQSALARAKTSRTSRLVTFHDEMRASHLSELQLDRDLRQAVARRAFQLYFQPIVSLSHGRAVGFEALLRWPHPTQGLVSPASFIPLAERTGLIVPLGFWVLDEACRGLRALHESTPSLRDTYVTVNISPLQLHQADFVRQVLRTLDSHGLSPSKLRLEITEDSAMSNAEATIVVLRDLRAAGIQILLDDFGTGYSALHYLVRLPADVVKVDRTFVDGVGADARKTRVITTIVDLADSLGMKLVAEGVETAEQLAWLARLGFQDAQGFLFARPVPWQQAVTFADIDLRRTGG